MSVTRLLNDLELICLLIIIAMVSTQLNDFSYFYLALIILSNINQLFVDSDVVTSITIKHWLFYSTLLICLHSVKWFQVLLCITDNSFN